MFLILLTGRIVSVGKDQDGSRYIQQRLAIADVSEIELVYEEAMAAIEGRCSYFCSSHFLLEF